LIYPILFFLQYECLLFYYTSILLSVEYTLFDTLARSFIPTHSSDSAFTFRLLDVIDTASFWCLVL